MKTAVLCYHSWNLELRFLAEDIEGLRKNGWKDISLAELVTLKKRRGLSGKKFFHITNDDAAPADGSFSDCLQSLACPATFFVPSGNLLPDRVDFYRRLDQGGLVTIEDHSLHHRKMFLGPKFVEFFSEKARSTGLEPLRLERGMPIVEFGSELAGPLFHVDEKVNAFCKVKSNGVDLSDVESTLRDLIRPLISLGLARKRAGRIYVLGHFESRVAYRRRIEEYLKEGRRRFEAIFERVPLAFCYPIYQFSAETERCLGALGYELRFAGMNRLWNGRSALVPRISVGTASPRPLDLDAMSRRPLRQRAGDALMAVGLKSG